MFFQQSKAFICAPAGYHSVYHTFSINSIMIDGRKSTLDLWQEEDITLPPKSTCQINISIPQIWKPEPNRERPPDRPVKKENATPVLVGNYKLRASLFLTNEDGKPRVFITKPEPVTFFVTEPVAIKYLD